MISGCCITTSSESGCVPLDSLFFCDLYVPIRRLWLCLLSSTAYKPLSCNAKKAIPALLLMYTTTHTINFGPPLGSAESYVCSSSISTEIVQGRYLHSEAIGHKTNMEQITFRTLNGEPGVWLFDVLHGTAVIESPDTKYCGIKAYQMLSLKVRVSAA